MGMRHLLAFQLLAAVLPPLAAAEEASAWLSAGHVAACASNVGSGAVAGGGVSAVVALLLGTPVASAAAGGLLLGVVAGGILLDGCQSSKVAEPPLQKEAAHAPVQLLQPALRHARSSKSAQPSTLVVASTSKLECNGRGPCMLRKYEGKWPNCANMKCFTAVDLNSAKSFCMAQADCDGFSMSGWVQSGGSGAGCYKTKCSGDDGWNGFENGADNYWSKVQVSKDANPTREKALDVFLQRLMPALSLENTASKDQHCNAKGLCLVRKYRNRWPNCNNLRCFSHLTLEDAQNVCLSHPACNGFSISAVAADNKQRGAGCYKMTCKSEGWNGYSSGADDYWAKMAPQPVTNRQLLSVPALAAKHAADNQHTCDGRGTCITKKYERRWPNCENLNCFSNVKLKDAKASCLSHAACHGFSVSGGIVDDGPGSGCYKTSCEKESRNGYATGLDDYWAKAPEHSSSGAKMLVSATRSPAQKCDGRGMCMQSRYKRKWPNCENLKCFSGIDLEDARMACLSHPSCDGFSMSEMAMEGGKGDGCYKTKCHGLDEGRNGYDFGSDGYWAKVGNRRTSYISPSLVSGHTAAQSSCDVQGVCIQKRYERKWPNCNNLYCFSNLDLENAKAVCLAHPACSGFSMSEMAMEGGRGDGCYKTTCEHEGWNGYDTGSDGYFAKVLPKNKAHGVFADPQHSTKKEQFLNAMIQKRITPSRSSASHAKLRMF